MENLTENNIKRAALSFLKSYYRYRPRAGDTQSSIDMRGEGGIIADGFLSFQKEDGQNFLATFEATSYNTKKEVIYKVERDLLFWDSFTFALVGTAAFFTYAYIKDILTVKEIGLWATVGINLGLAVALFLFYRIIFSPWNRYRYIYAVEQFKKYHADEQWIALGEDVFANPEDPFLEELRKQCIQNGFGLIIVDEKNNAHLNITPSRKEIFQNQRKMVEFFRLEELSKRMNQRQYKGLLGKLKPYFTFFIPGADSTALLRYRKTYHIQRVLSGFALIMIFGILHEEIQNPDIVYVDEKDYEKEVIEMARQNREEPGSIVIDSFAFRPFDRKVNPYLEIENPIVQNLEEEEAVPEIIVYDNRNRRLTYDCERFYNFEKRLYMIQHSLHPRIEDAMAEVNELSRLKFEANILWLGCFEADEDDYAVYLDLLYNSKWEAQADARDFQDLLEEKKRPAKLTIRSIDPPQTEW